MCLLAGSMKVCPAFLANLEVQCSQPLFCPSTWPKQSSFSSPVIVIIMYRKGQVKMTSLRTNRMKTSSLLLLIGAAVASSTASGPPQQQHVRRVFVDSDGDGMSDALEQALGLDSGRTSSWGVVNVNSDSDTDANDGRPTRQPSSLVVVGIGPSGARQQPRTWDSIGMSADTLNPPDRNQMFGSRPILEYDPFSYLSEATNDGGDGDGWSNTWSNTPEITSTNPVPSNPSRSYFNYDPNSQYGPEGWRRVRNAAESEYWDEDFDQYINTSLRKNVCDSNSRRQSPIDVRFDDANGQCFEYHQIRSREGGYSITRSIVHKQILSSKLRVVYPRSYDPDANWATDNDAIYGPSADIAKGWGKQLPLTHIDIKIPSEHWMEGKQYAAEYQLFFIQNREEKMRGAPAVSILMDLHPDDIDNSPLQTLLDAFQDQFDADQAECERRQRKARRLGAFLGKEIHDQSSWLDEPEEEAQKFQANLWNAERKAQQQFTNFDPFDENILRSIYFFGYEGSLTEPPCAEFVEWRIIDKPALISKRQLEQAQRILFKHVDEDCKATSVDFNGSVARPIQPYSGRLVHRCMCRDYIGDEDRIEYGENRCAWAERDIFGFSKDTYTKEWFDRTHRYEEPEDQPLTDWASF